MYNLIIATLLLMLSSTNYAACNSAITRTAPDSRYELLNSNTEVKDKQTGLIWQRCSLGQTWSGTSCTKSGAVIFYNWANALQTAKNMGGGWRVPNIRELASLIEQACYSPSINDVFFPNTFTVAHYRSSSPRLNGSGWAWVVSFDSGSDITKRNYEYLPVRLVRSDQ
jgi:hypothetical protein